MVKRMTDDPSPSGRRAKRQAPLLDLKADDKTPQTEASVAESAVGPEVSAQPEPVVETVPEPETSAEPAAAEPSSMPTPAPRPSLALPMAVAALVGGVLGTIGSMVIPAVVFPPAKPQVPAEVMHLRQQITVLEGRLAASPQVAQIDELKRNLDVANKRADELDAAVKAVANRPAPQALTHVDPGLNQRLAAAEQAARDAGTRATAAVQAIEPRVTALGDRVEQSVRRLDAGSAAPLFVAIQGLAQAFHRGAPFATELQAVELLGGKAELVAPLKALAQTGAPSVARLRDMFSTQAGELADLGKPKPAGVTGWLQSFVRVRPLDAQGDTPPALVAATEIALRDGKLTDALAAWMRLPETHRTASAAFGKALTEREAAGKALNALQDAAAAALKGNRP
jgi:hypothetical protein